MNASKRRLILRLARFARICDDIHEKWQEAADLDAGFDAGEWSGPACERAAEKECDRAAQRIGFASAELACDAMQALGMVWRVGMFDAVLIGGELPAWWEMRS